MGIGLRRIGDPAAASDVRSSRCSCYVPAVNVFTTGSREKQTAPGSFASGSTVPGIGAGCILVFILSIGYYITPALVGGRTGTFISNIIALHISETLNWGLAAALGVILLALVLLLYFLYDRIVGVANMKLG